MALMGFVEITVDSYAVLRNNSEWSHKHSAIFPSGKNLLSHYTALGSPVWNTEDQKYSGFQYSFSSFGEVACAWYLGDKTPNLSSQLIHLSCAPYKHWPKRISDTIFSTLAFWRDLLHEVSWGIFYFEHYNAQKVLEFGAFGLWIFHIRDAQCAHPHHQDGVGDICLLSLAFPSPSLISYLYSCVGVCLQFACVYCVYEGLCIHYHNQDSKQVYYLLINTPPSCPILFPVNHYCVLHP